MSTFRFGDRDLTEDVISVVFYCPSCGVKSTYGREYFTPGVKTPDCPCGRRYAQDDHIIRTEADDENTLRIKREHIDMLRGKDVVRDKPEDPAEIMRGRIVQLRDELERLESGRPETGPRLGP